MAFNTGEETTIFCSTVIALSFLVYRFIIKDYFFFAIITKCAIGSIPDFVKYVLN